LVSITLSSFFSLTGASCFKVLKTFGFAFLTSLAGSMTSVRSGLILSSFGLNFSTTLGSLCSGSIAETVSGIGSTSFLGSVSSHSGLIIGSVSYLTLNSSYPSTSAGSNPSFVLSTSSRALREISSSASRSCCSLFLNSSNCFSLSTTISSCSVFF